MASNGQRRQKGSYVEVKSELSKLRLDMQGFAVKINTVEKDKENLRCINQTLLKKIKEQSQKDYPFKILLLKKQLETEREKFILKAQKLVEIQTLAVFSRECFDISIDTEGNKPSMILRNAMDVMKGIGRQCKEENSVLTRKVDDLLKNQRTLNQELKSLKKENQHLKEDKMAEFLTSQAIIDSLQDLLEEQQENKQAEIQELQNKMDTSKQQESVLNRRISEIEEQICSAKERLSQSENEVANYKEAKAGLEMKADDLMKKLIGLEELAAESTAKLEALQMEVQEWQSRAIASDTNCLELAKKLEDSHQRQLSMLQDVSKSDEKAQNLCAENMLLNNSIKAKEQELKDMKDRLQEANGCYEAISSNLLEITSERNYWKEKAEESETTLMAAEKRNDNLEEDKNKLLRTMLQEFDKHLEHSLSLKSKIAWLQRDTQMQGCSIDALESENVVLTDQLEELRKQEAEEKSLKSKAQDNLRVMIDENAKLNDVINQLEQRIESKRNRRWWRRLVSCS